MDTFKKFDHLGSTLSELSFDAASIHMHRRESGTIFFGCYLHTSKGRCSSGQGDTPSEALSNALAESARREALAVEIASERAAA